MTLRYQGEIIEITDLSEAENAVGILRQDAVHQDITRKRGSKPCRVGFDMEWQHESAPGMDNPVALIQVASKEVCLIFYMLKIGSMPPALEELLLDKHFLKVGLAVTNDLRKLSSQFFLIPRGLLDVAPMARRLGYTRLGLQSLVQDLFRLHVVKGKARSNWGSDQLTDGQLSYAATDAFATLLIYKQLEVFEADEGKEHYWTMVLADDEAAVEAELNAVGPRIRELKESVRKLTRRNADLAARLAAVEAEAQRTKAAYEAEAQRTRAAFKAEAQRTRAAFQAEVQQMRDAFEDRLTEIEEQIFW